jgi:hypothetical protein
MTSNTNSWTLAPEVVAHVAPSEHGWVGYRGRRLLALATKPKLERILARMLDENEFLGPHGIRSLSRYHLDHPFSFWAGNQEYNVQYLPAESNTGMFGGNSNRRGPVWMPINVLILRALLNLYSFYGDELKVQCPTGSGRYMTLFKVAEEIHRRLAGIFLRDAAGPSTGERRNSRRIRIGATSFFSTSTFRATTAPGWGPAIKPGGLDSSLLPWTSSDAWVRRPP